MSNKGIPLLLIVTTLLITACGDSSTKSQLEKVVGDVIRDEQIQKIDTAVKNVMDEFQLPGVSLALISDKSVVYSRGFGVTNLQSGNAVTADTSFWLGSVSKAVVGVALMRAQEEGLVGLDDHVQTLLANDSRVGLSLPHNYPVLLRHLVTHTSGIVDSNAYECAYFVGEEHGEHYSLANAYIDGDCDEGSPVDLPGYLNAYLFDAGAYYSSTDNFTESEPGARYEYSNIAAGLAGYIIEAITGTSLIDYAASRIFAPLGMSNTSWKRDSLDQDNIATPYVWDEASKTVAALPLYDLSTWPDGGLRGSANDMAKFLLAIMNRGEFLSAGSTQRAVRVLEKESVVTLLEPMVDSGEGDGLDVGVFWVTTQTPAGRELIGHTGSDPGAYSFVFFDPEENVGIVLMGSGDDEITETFGSEIGKLIEALLKAAEVLGDI